MGQALLLDSGGGQMKLRATFIDWAGLTARGNSIDHIVDGRLYVQSYTDEDALVYSVNATGVAEAFRVPSGDLWYLTRVH